MSGTPPLGEAVVPIAGYPGTAGSPVVTSVGGWSTGPGAITWHGGPWVMPYSTPPGSSLQNVSCDVVPNATSTDLVELVSSNGQVLGSNTVPAVTGVTIRIWIILSPGHAVIDGEQLVLRHTPRDSTTGAWTSAVQDLTLLGCAVHATRPRIIPLSGLTAVPEWPTQAGGPGATRIANTWTFASQNYMYFPVTVTVGDTLVGYGVYTNKGSSSAFTLTSNLIEVDGPSGTQTALASASTALTAPGHVTLAPSSFSRVVPPAATYLIRIADGSGSVASNADSFTDAFVLVQ